MKFRDLDIEQFFDFINDEKPGYNSFYDRCMKISARKYKSTQTDIVYTVGSINAEVYHPSASRVPQ